MQTDDLGQREKSHKISEKSFLTVKEAMGPPRPCRRAASTPTLPLKSVLCWLLVVFQLTAWLDLTLLLCVVCDI
eukprot:m.67464 g.67464  ORF g.67464 m.67464 type:complete len:74 (-) comp49969_c0_seq3:74-295(-)